MQTSNESAITPFIVKLIRTANGERLPVLIDRDSGIPDFDATLWVVSSLRNQNAASETITQALRSLVLLYTVLRKCKVNLCERLGTGNLLTLAEIQEISTACRRRLSATVESLPHFTELTVSHPRRISSLERLRMPQKIPCAGEQVSAQTAFIRLKYIRDFLTWRVNLAACRVGDEAKSGLLSNLYFVDAELENAAPSQSKRNVIFRRMGIDSEMQAKLIQALEPDSISELWTGNHVRLRNQLIVYAFLSLGIRRGELLGLRINDFSPQAQEVLILRRPDDASDPRLYEPNAKTRDRILPVSYELHCLIKNYMKVRRERVKERHNFLFISNNGSPISHSAVNRIFIPLRRIIPQILSPHVLRHTFFENLAMSLYDSGQTDSQVQSILARLGGWSEFSQSVQRYTSRFYKNRASEAGMAMQSKIYIGGAYRNKK